MDKDWFTLERLEVAIRRMRASKYDLNRVLTILERDAARTLKSDLKEFETRQPGRKLDSKYVEAVCRAFYATTQDTLHNELFAAVIKAPHTQDRLQKMVGLYDAYWPSGVNEFEKFPFEISCEEGVYLVSDRTAGKNNVQYGHTGLAFLIRNRVHVTEPTEDGLRNMIFHYEERPFHNPVKGIISNVLGHSSDDSKDSSVDPPHMSEQIFAAHFIAFHEKDERYYGRTIPPQQIAGLLHHPRNRAGVIRV